MMLSFKKKTTSNKLKDCLTRELVKHIYLDRYLLYSLNPVLRIDQFSKKNTKPNRESHEIDHQP